MDIPILELKNISLQFQNKTIFNNFNLKIENKQKVLIFGRSGSGKSTLLKLILGFIPLRNRGEIFFENKKVNEKTIWLLRRNIAYVDQDATIGQGKIKNIILEYFSFHNNSDVKFSISQILTLMRELNLDKNLLGKNSEKLSGGERQRIALIIAILLKRKLMLLDEPTSMLDPYTKRLVIKKISQLDTTVVIVSHDKEWREISNIKIFNFEKKEWEQ